MAAALHFHQSAHERESDSEPAVRTGKRTVDLRERFEDVGDEFRRYADARITHPEHDLVAILLGAALVFLRFPNKEEEERLLAEYHAQDTQARPDRTGQIQVKPATADGGIPGVC